MSRDGSRDFDFLFGEWNVRHERLHRPLSGSDDSYVFTGTASARPLLNGDANIDENVLQYPTGSQRAISLRFYDAAAEQWSIYWATDTGGLFPLPAVGAFDATGIGRFYIHQRFEGRAVLVKYLWSGIGASSCRWVQAFSNDGGAHWEDNWIMEFARAC